MKTEADILTEIERTKADERYQLPCADVFINAPLALIQVDLEARIRALEWVLTAKGEQDE